MAVYTTIDNPELYFQVKVYTGNYTDAHAITLDGDTDMQPDMVWIKDRSDTSSHTITDSVRGVTKTLYPDTTTAEGTEADYVQAFGSDGFTVGANNNNNESGESNVAWCWKESATAGFDIVSYTGTGSAHTEAHSLSAAPRMIITKNRDYDTNWGVYHASQTADKYAYLSATNAFADNSVFWNDTEPTSSVFSVGTYESVNRSGDEMIAYCFAEKQGFSKFGSYEGNGNADGTFVHLGFRPAWLMVKPVDAADNWVMFDNKRLGFNSSTSPYFFYANKNFAETTDDLLLDFLSNGFKMRDAGNTVNRTSTFIYMAFAEAPFVNSNGVPCNAR